MAKASDNEFPSVLFDEQPSDVSTPGSGLWRAYFKSDGFYVIDDGGGVTGPMGSGGGGGGGDVPYEIAYLTARQDGETPHTDDDFFTSNTSGDYTEVDISGTSTWLGSTSRGKLSVVVDDQSSLDYSAYLKPITSASAPMTIETRVRGYLPLIDFPSFGIAFTDGTASGSNVVSCIIQGSDAAVAAGGAAIYAGTLTSFGADIATVFVSQIGTGYIELYLRLIWDSANTWNAGISLDGNLWYNRGLSNQSKSFTPTHIGFVASTSSHGSPWMGSFDYLRVYDADLTPSV